MFCGKSKPNEARTASFFILFYLAGMSTGAVGSAPRRSQIQHEVTTTLKLVQVYVTDRAGKPIRDLTKQDFSLSVDGKPVAITDFECHGFKAPTSETSPSSSSSPPSSGTRGAQTLNRYFLIFFDFAYNSAHGIIAGVQAAQYFLDTQVQPEDQVSLVSYSLLKGLRIHEFFTSDHKKIRAALSKVTSKDIAGRADEVEQAYWMMADTSGIPRPLSREEQARINVLDQQRHDSGQQVRKYFRDLTVFAQALSLVPGQKSVLFFSLGVPSSLINMTRTAGTNQMISEHGNWTQMSTGTVFPVGDSVLLSLQKNMLKEFNSSGCSFFVLDTRESSKIPALFAYDEAALADRPAGGLLASETGGLFRDEKTTGMDTLRRLSRQTGGKYYSNIVLHEQSLEEVSAITESYYVLGFPISSTEDGRFHAMKVTVKKKGFQVRTQPGYFDPKPFRAYTKTEKDLHLFDLALRERSELSSVETLPGSALFYDLGPGPEVRVLASFPQTIWRYLRGHETEVVALFFGQDGNLFSLQRSNVSPAELREKDVLFTTAAPAPPGLIKCRVIVRDLDSGRSAVSTAEVYVPSEKEPHLAAFSPLLLARGGGIFLIEGQTRKGEVAGQWRSIYPMESSLFSPLLGDEAVRTPLVIILLPCRVRDAIPAILAASVNLIDSRSGASVPLQVSSVGSTRAANIQILELELPLGTVPPGRYFLYAHIVDTFSKEETNARTLLIVER